MTDISASTPKKDTLPHEESAPINTQSKETPPLDNAEAPDLDVEEVSNFYKDRETVDDIVKQTKKIGTDSDHAGSFGITEREAKPSTICVSKDTASHIIGNTHLRLKNRTKDILTGIAGESVSAGLALAASAASASNGGSSNALIVALSASTAVVSVLSYRLFKNHQSRIYLRAAAQNYTHDHPDAKEQAKKLIRSLKDHDLAIDDSHKMSKDMLKRKLGQAEDYGTKRSKKSQDSAFGQLKTQSQNVHSFNKQLIKDFADTPRQLPKIMKDTAIGIKDAFASPLYADTLSKKLDAQNAALYVAMIGTFFAEVTFIGANGVGISDQLSPIFQAANDNGSIVNSVKNNASNLLTSTLSGFAILASALPMAQLAREVSYDKKALTKNSKTFIRSAFDKVKGKILKSDLPYQHNGFYTGEADFYTHPAASNESLFPDHDDIHQTTSLDDIPPKPAPYALDYYNNPVTLSKMNDPSL